MYYYDIKQELISQKIISKEDMYLLESKLLFTNTEAFDRVYKYFDDKQYSMITGTPRNYSHWSQQYTNCIYFENL
jgi:hypothetical protein